MTASSRPGLPPKFAGATSLGDGWRTFRVMPTNISPSHAEAEGDLIAYTIGEEGPGDVEYDIAIAGGENTVPDTSTARAIIAGDFVSFDGVITFDGADAVLNFTLPEDVWPFVDQAWPISVNDGGTLVTGTMQVGDDGAVVITNAAAAAFASGDTVTLSGGYLRA